MTALAIRGSRFQNGVSRIHGEVSSRICAPMWPQIPPEENPIDYVTNGVHVPTFLSARMGRAVRAPARLGWSLRLADPVSWDGVQEIPDQLFWSMRQSLKVQMLHLVRNRVQRAAPAQPGFRGAPGPDPAAGGPGQPERADHRLRAALRHLQARGAAVPAIWTGCARSSKPRASGAVHFRRQGAPGRRAGPAH